jgi:CBS domain-containing protein
MKIESLHAADICRTDIVTAEEHTSLYEVSKLMREHHIGDVVITRSDDSGQKPIGILTDRDIVVHGIACDIDLDEVTAGDLSKQDLVTVRPEAGVSEIVSTMNVHAVRRVIVDGASDYSGIITFDDIIWALSRIVSNLSAVTGRQIQHEIEAEVRIDRTGS